MQRTPMVHGEVSISGFRLVAHAYTRTLYLPVCEGAFERTTAGTDLRYTLRPKIVEAIPLGLAYIGFTAYGVVSGTITPVLFAAAAHLFAYVTGFIPAEERISSALEQAAKTER
jgi:hypothetical protein